MTLVGVLFVVGVVLMLVLQQLMNYHQARANQAQIGLNKATLEWQRIAGGRTAQLEQQVSKLITERSEMWERLRWAAQRDGSPFTERESVVAEIVGGEPPLSLEEQAEFTRRQKAPGKYPVHDGGC